MCLRRGKAWLSWQLKMVTEEGNLDKSDSSKLNYQELKILKSIMRTTVHH